MSGVRSALLFSFAERYALIIINLASNLLIARLLTPDQIGVYSVTLAVISIAQVLRDFGVASYLIQEKDLTDDHIRTALGVTLIIGIGLGGVVFGAAPWVADFYREPRMRDLLWLASLNFLLLPFSTISLALLRRRLAFKALAVVNFAATLAGAITSVSLSWAGFGPLGLVAGTLVVSATTGFAAWWAQGERRLMRPGLSKWRSLFKFGAQSSLVGVVTSVSMDINDLAVGKLMGFTPVALLSRAQGLMNLFHRDLMGAVRNVAYPAFAKAVREQQAMEPLYLTSVTYVCVVAWPFYGFVALYGLETLRLLFGPQWDAAAPLVPIFCLAGALAAMISLIGNLMVAMGRMDLLTRMEVVFQPGRAALIVAAAAYWREPWACAAALVVANLLQLPLVYVVKDKFLPNDWRTLRAQLARSLAVALLALALPTLLLLLHPREPGQTLPIPWFVLAILSCCLSWLLALAWCRHPLAADPVFARLTRFWRRSADNAA
ncbi:O-antigen/teichoic acid export membrane protein [Pelomonas saccharophila]|uniref:O-antigen/teichoic acid export membrane protein n=1 Tax=Roseateles saccharophilus TaxID=304 RepID=A0ABU1YQL7_ROSSA|nr:lipopolysaccharide biosynthesis protein [Roseateles saccharophilus]MDR7271155.1 O-antigen/teichoic acid export membrane protein [Roseateles saccharophilus]